MQLAGTFQFMNRSPTIPESSFYLPLSDAGAGLVSTTPLIALGVATATFTRATVAWTKLSTGLWKQIASGSARSHYLGADTTVGTYGGYLAEGAGIQLVTPTASIRDMTDASWVKTTMTAAKTATGIDGAANSCTTLTATAGNGTALQTLAAAATSRTYHCFIKRRTGTGNIELTQDGATFTNIAGSLNSSTYTRVSLNATQLNASFGIRIVTSGDAIDVDFNQFEAGAFATSPMDAAGAVRNADVLTYAFAGNALATAGSAYAELATEWATSASASYAIDFSAGGGSPLAENPAVAATSILEYDGTTAFPKTGLSDMSTGSRKRASSWGGNGQRVTGDGLSVATAAFDGNMGSTSVAIGCTTGGANQWYGTVKNVRILLTQLSDSDLQTMTAS